MVRRLSVTRRFLLSPIEVRGATCAVYATANRVGAEEEDASFRPLSADAHDSTTPTCEQEDGAERGGPNKVSGAGSGALEQGRLRWVRAAWP